MTQKQINIGTSPNKGDGDPLRTAFGKINDNFDELYATDTLTKYHLGDDVQFVDIDPDSGTIVIQSGFDTGMPVYIKGANCSDGGVGGNVVIEAGGPGLPNDGTTGNIELAAQQITIESNNNMWTFRDDGVLELPEGGDIVDSNGDTVLGGTGGSSDRLINGDYELVLNVNGAGPWISFPESGGSNIQIQGCDITGVGFELLIQSAEDGVRLSADATSIARKDWLFGTDGALTFPGTGTINNTSGGAPTGTIYTFNTDYNGDTPILTDATSIDLVSGGNADNIQANWIIKFANGTTRTVTSRTFASMPNRQQVFWADAFTSAVPLDIWPLTVQSADYSAGGITSLEITPDGTTTWTFSDDGRTTFPNGTVPEHSYGAAGDKEGMVVFTDPYIYYCKQDYVDDLTDIWVRVAWTGTNW